MYSGTLKHGLYLFFQNNVLFSTTLTTGRRVFVVLTKNYKTGIPPLCFTSVNR